MKNLTVTEISDGKTIILIGTNAIFDLDSSIVTFSVFHEELQLRREYSIDMSTLQSTQYFVSKFDVKR